MNALLPAFEFTDIITSNAAGAVYFANQRSLGRQVAIKVYSPMAENGDAFRKSFGNASRLMAGLKHTNLIGLLDSGHAGNLPYQVMEFVPGKSLARSTRGQVVEFRQAMALFDGICEGLAHAHGKGLVHGHLDTLSILLNQQAVPKIGGFGLERAVHTDTEALVPVHCTAPEVLAKPGTATVRSDVYSLGAIFYELITGTPMAPGAAPASTLTTCRSEIDAVLKQATATDPDGRMADVRAFHTALKGAAAGPDRKAGGGAAQSPPAPRKAVVQSGHGPKMLLKVAIIIGLLFGINLAWKAKDSAHADRARENREIIAKGKKEREDAIALAAAERASNVAKPASQPLPEAAVPEMLIPEAAVPEPVPEVDPMEAFAAALAADLTATRLSLAGESPVYPPGTVTSGSRHYVYVPYPVTWEQAGGLAESGGGHLMVPSDSAEIGELEEVTGGIVADKGIWLGASLDDGVWQWVTGEPWTEAKWIGNARSGEEGTAMVVRPGKGWDTMARGDEASGFLIEWSDDLKAATPGETVSAAALAAAELTTRVQELVLAADKKRSVSLAENVKKFTWDLDAFVKGLAKGGQTAWRPHVDALKGCVKDNRILPEEIGAKGISVSPEMVKLVNYHIKKQGEIGTQFAGDAGKIRDAFVAKLAAIRDDAKAAGQTKVFGDTAATIEKAEDLGAWIRSFGLTLDEVPVAE